MSDLVQAIDVNLIDAPQFDSRVNRDPAKVKAIGESMKAQGQLEPIRVEQAGERYKLVFGGTRLAGAKMVGIPEILAVVVPPMSEADQAIINGIENVQRSDLSTFELARLCAMLREKGLKLAEVSGKLGISQSHVSNLVTTYVGLPDEIKTQWAAGDEAASVDFLRFLLTKEDDKGKKVAREPAEMVVLYKERQESLKALYADLEDDDDDDDDDKGGKFKAHNKKNAPFKVPRDKYKLLLRSLKGQPQIATDVARYLVGEIEKIRGLKIETPEAKETKKKGDK